VTTSERRTLRVLHVLRYYHPHVGGTENFVAHLAEALAEHGVASSVLSSTRYSGEDGPRPRVPVERLSVVGSNRMPFPYRGLTHAVALARGADIIHVHDLRFLLELAALTSRLHRVPLVLSSHGFMFHTRYLAHTKELAWRTYYRMLLAQCSAILCGSQHDLAACRKIALANARLWPTPVRVEPFERVEPEPGDRRSLLYFGRIAPNKGLERLVGMLEQAPWSLTIAGTGDAAYVGTLQSLFSRFGSRVTFTGQVAEEQLPRLIAGHACVVLPSRAEGFGLTLVEALAAGVPVVASDIPSYREIAHDSPARLVDFDDARGVVEHIRVAVESWNPTAARGRARTFSWRVRGADLASLYRAVAGE
jgi:alpha-1,3-mannosyltransferase